MESDQVEKGSLAGEPQLQQLLEILVGQLGQGGLSTADDGLGQRPLRLVEVGNSLLQSSLRGQTMDLDGLVLSDPVSTIGRLILRCRVPPAPS
jgi:hypothetical protein